MGWGFRVSWRRVRVEFGFDIGFSSLIFRVEGVSLTLNLAQRLTLECSFSPDAFSRES